MELENVLDFLPPFRYTFSELVYVLKQLPFTGFEFCFIIADAQGWMLALSLAETYTLENE